MTTDAVLHLTFPATDFRGDDQPTTGVIQIVSTSPTTGSMYLDNMTPSEGDTLTIKNTFADANGIKSIVWSWYENDAYITPFTVSLSNLNVGSVYHARARVYDFNNAVTEFRTPNTDAVTSTVTNHPTTGGITLDNMSPMLNDLITIVSTVDDANGIKSIIWSWSVNGSILNGADQQVISSSTLGATYQGHAAVTDNGDNVSTFDTLVTAATMAENHPTQGSISLNNMSPKVGDVIQINSTLNDQDGLKSIDWSWYINGNSSTADQISFTAVTVGDVYRARATVTDNLDNVEVFDTLTTNATTAADNEAESGWANGIRQWPAIAYRSTTHSVFNAPPSDWFDSAYDEFHTAAVSQHPQAFNNVVPVLFQHIKWTDLYINSGTLPTQAQAIDPDWGNYIWNRTGTPGSGLVWDGITAALEDALVNDGNGIAKLGIILGLTASGGANNLPNFILNNNSWHWIEDDNANGLRGEHARFDVQAVVNHAKWMLTAFLAKYGANNGIHHIQIAEYYFGGSQYYPSGFSQSSYLAGMRQLWDHMDDVAPVTNGSRVALMQQLPRFDGGTTQDDLFAAKIGASISDTILSFPIADFPSLIPVKAATDAGLPSMLTGDLRYRLLGRTPNWSNAPTNPLNITGGSHLITLDQLGWYYGATGPCPVTTFGMARSYDPAPEVINGYRAMLGRFGRGGTQAGQWGPVPAPISGLSETIPGGQPVITTAMVSGVEMAYSTASMSGIDNARTKTRWERNGALTPWEGSTYSLKAEHVGDTFRVRVEVYNVGGSQPFFIFSDYYGPVTAT